MSLEVNMKEPTKRPHPRYTLEFKKDAAKLVDEKAYTHPHAADNLGIYLSARGALGQSRKSPYGNLCRRLSDALHPKGLKARRAYNQGIAQCATQWLG
jgi:hypothetical protein